MVVAVLTAVALTLRLYRLRDGYAHGVLDYDGGVYFGSSLALSHGALPYRDFVFVHPPLITVLLTPFALLAKVIGTGQAMGLAKIATAVAGAAAVPLVARLLRGRPLPVVALAGALVAVDGDSVASSFTPLLEPWLVLFCLLGAVLVFPHRDGVVAGGRRLGWGGVLFGLACATKIWAVVPVLAVVLVCLVHRARVRRFVLGVAVGLVPVLPFALAAPGAFVHQVIVSQVLRTPEERTATEFRMLHLFGVSPANADLPTHAASWLYAGAIVLAALLAVVFAQTLRAGTALDRFAVLAALLVVAMLFVPGTFYWHYAAFASPFLAVAAAVSLTRVSRLLGRVVGAGLLALALGHAAAIVALSAHATGTVDEHRRVDALVPAGACVVTNVGSTTIAADRYSSDRPGCPELVDPYGSVLALTGRPPTLDPPRSRRLTQLWLDAYRRADFVHLIPRTYQTLPVDPSLRRYLRAHFRVVGGDGLYGTLYARTR